MSDLTAKFASLEEQLAAQAAASDALVDTVEEKLQFIFDTLDVMNENNAVNTRALLAAMHANSPCSDCEPVDISVPPTDDTGLVLNEDKCKRTQAFLHALEEVFTVLDTMSAFGVPFTPSLITNAINQVITALANGDTTPLPSYPEMIRLVGDGIIYVTGGFLVGDTLIGYYMPLIFDLRDAIYQAPDAGTAQGVYNDLIDSTDAIPGYAKNLMKDAAYNELWSFYFDPSSDVNLDGYSGTVCAPPTEGCYLIFSGTLSTANGTIVNETFTGYDYYRSVVTGSSGNQNHGLFCNGALQANDYGNAEELMCCTGTCLYFSSSEGPGGATYALYGCFGTPEEGC